MKRVFLTLVIGLMTMVGYSQTFENIVVYSSLEKQNIQNLRAFDVLFKSDSLKTKCDSILVKSFFKEKFNKKFTLIDVFTVNGNTEVTRSKVEWDSNFFMGTLYGLKVYYNNTISVTSTDNEVEIYFGENKEKDSYKIDFKRKLIIKTTFIGS